MAKRTRKRGTGSGRTRKPEELWRDEPDLIRRFIATRPDYEHLCIEVEYILRKRLQAARIETAAVTSRAKTLDSFLEKIQRKHYDDPLAQVTDFAGARVVCLYRSDTDKLGTVIKQEFEVVEELDKATDLSAKEFGYLARHYLVQLGKASSGARYDDLKHLRCEVQVRTVVQDAWAIIQHHMIYKREAQVPTALQRKLNGLAGLFETADDQFEHIRAQREAYVADVRTATEEPTVFLDTELNLDSFLEYLKWRFPDRTPELNAGQARVVLDALLADGIKDLRHVDDLLRETHDERAAAFEEMSPALSRAPNGTTSACLEPAVALGIVRADGESGIPFGPRWLGMIRKHRKASRKVRH